MKEIDLSIIVPVYNMEKYLNKCIDSLINQKKTAYTYEILCVNDGSTDSSLSILNEYESLNNGLVKVINIENGGVSNARNVGIENALGKLITFVDSDDWVDENLVELSVENMKNNDIDLIIFDSYYVNDKEVLHKESVKGTVFNTENHACSKVFKMEIIKKYNIGFPSDLTIGEDMVFTFSYISAIDKFKHIDKAMYYYRQNRDDSSMNLAVNTKYKEVFKACEYIYSFAEKNKMLKNKQSGIEYLFIKNLIVRNTVKVIKNNKINKINSELKKQYNILNEYFGNWNKNIFLLEDNDNYFKNKLGRKYMKVLQSLENNNINFMYYFIIGKLEGKIYGEKFRRKF